jgi:protein tyrosine phosphatase (PTP) superfamily phosphohydrolase (DUF442 family)
MPSFIFFFLLKNIDNILHLWYNEIDGDAKEFEFYKHHSQLSHIGYLTEMNSFNCWKMPKILLFSISLIFLVSFACQAEGKKVERPTEWAITVKKDSLKNMYKVTDNFYRSAQPSAEGMAKLKKMGIKTIINLRRHHTDDDEIKDTGMETVHIPINTWHMKDKYVVQFLKIAINPEKQPILLHCKHGSDRTGTMCAMYRIVIQGWSKEDAIKEMKEGGYGYHKMWKNLIKYIENVDVRKINRHLSINN